MKTCTRCYVSGDVQGVFFRDSTRKKASELGVTGYARNLGDGRVEVLACGEEKAVNSLRDWLWEGSSSARVKDVQCESISYQEIEGFRTA